MKHLTTFFKFQEKHRLCILAVIFILTAFFAFEASKIKVNADFSVLFNQYPSKTYMGGEGTFDSKETQQLLDSFPSSARIDTTAIAAQPIPADMDEHADVTYPAKITSEGNAKGSGNLLLMIHSKSFFTPVFLNTLDICLENLKAQPDVHDYTSVFNYFTVIKKGSRLSLVPLSSHQEGTPWTDAQVMELRQRLSTDPTVTGYMVSADLQSVIFHLDTAKLSEERIYDLLTYLQPLEQYGATFSITGSAPITYRIMYYLTHDLTLLLGLCLIVILITFYLSFRAKRSMLLPFVLSIIGLIWTFGTMALLGYEITLINIVTPCMVLVLGSSYAVHLLSEYYRMHVEGFPAKAIPFKAGERIHTTIFLAAITTIIGFLSLLVSKVSGLREFGLSVSIGIAYCAILSLTFLPIALSFLDAPKQKQQEIFEHGILTRTIHKLATLVTEHWKIFCLVFVAVFVGFFLTKDKVMVDTNYMAYFPESDRIGTDTRFIAKELGGDMPFEVVLTAPSTSAGFFLDPVNLGKVYAFEQEVEKSPDILQDISFASYVAFLNKTYSGKEDIPSQKALLNLFSRLVTLLHDKGAGLIGKVISKDGNTLHIYLQSYDSIKKDVATTSSSARIETLLRSSLPLLPKGVSVQFKGTNAQALSFSRQLMKDQQASQMVSYLLVFILAAFAFCSAIRGLLTLIPVATAVAANYIFMYLLGIPFDMVTVSFASVAIGAGVDDAIHFLLHYTQHRKEHPQSPVKQTVRLTMEETGRAIVITTLSIVLGMLMLSFGSYTPIRFFGILMSIALMDSMLATILILPAAIVALDAFKNRQRRRKLTSTEQ
ncbi:MAG: efflux RND transporter permease subunit [Spirochaetia bacterium]|jgi:predicted RND superfamily exporter protein|nr:efflux RND transporter permease subunit [Spirochaetia bacterium]